jgi:hypothetical protein
MKIKKAERKELYIQITRLMLQNRNKEAFDALAKMAAVDGEIYVLADYDKCIAKALAGDKRGRI